MACPCLGRSYLYPSQAARARILCREVQVSRDPSIKAATCRRLREVLSEFGRDDPGAAIRARMCGCDLRGRK